MADKPPELVEQLEAGPSGARWRARLPDGREVLASQVLLGDESARRQGLDRLRRLAKIQSPNLLPLRGWWSDPQGVWFVSDLEQGVALPDLPGGGFLSPQQASAAAFGLLAGLTAIHSEGLNHGALSAANTRVMPDGRLVLAGHELASLGFPDGGTLSAEVREAGRIVCQAFGITPERNPRAAPRAIEHAAPALVVTARAIAAGNFGPDLALAMTALRDTAGPLAGSERLATGAQELAAAVATKRSGAQPARYRSLATPIGAPISTPVAAPVGAAPEPAGRPSVPTPSAGVPYGASPAPRRSWEERQARPLPHEYAGAAGRSSRWLIAAGIIAVLVLGIPTTIWAVRKLSAAAGQAESPAPPAPVRGSPTAGTRPNSPPAAASPIPGPIPVFAPASAGSVRGVEAKPTSACQPGGTCTINVVITFKPAGSPHDVTWKFKTFDPCTYQSVELGGGLITAQGDWNTTDGNTTVSLPAAKGQLVVVALSGPEQAASPPITLGSAGC